MPGVSDTGFEIKGFDQIKSELEENFRQIFGRGINLDSTSLLGQTIGVFSKNLYDLWQVLSDTYQSAYPATAQGLPLDQIVSLASLNRKAGFRTSGQVYLMGEIGTTVPRGTVLSTGAGAEVETNEAVDISAGVAPVFTLTKLPGVASLAFNVYVHQIFPGVHGEELLNRSAIINFTDPEATMKAKLDLLFSGEAETTVVKGATNDDPITVTVNSPFFLPVLRAQSVSLRVTTVGRADGVSVSATALEDGPIVIPGSAIKNIETPVSGFLSVTNFLDFVTGRFPETDTELRARWTSRVGGAQVSSSQAVASALQNISGVSNVLIFEPSAGVIEAIIEGGSGEEIAAALLASKPVGIELAGEVSETVLDENGNPKIVRFSRPENREVNLAISLESDADFPEDGEEQIRAAIDEYQNSLPIGGAIRVSPDIVWALQGIRGMNELVIYADGDSDLKLETRQRAVFSPVNIVISEQQ